MLSTCLLLLVAEAPSHGYELAQSVKGHGVAVAQLGSVYHRLKALERDGLIRSDLETAQPGPARRVYRLTPDGNNHVRTGNLTLDHIRRAAPA